MLNKLVLLCAFAAAAAAQNWEVGAIGGYGFSPNMHVKTGTASADTGFRPGGVVGVFGGEDSYRYWGGEARYLYRFSDLKLASGNADVHFGGHTHIIEGNFMAHFRPRESRVRPFFAFGGGIKVIQGTGRESAAQPLGRFAALTATREMLPVAGVGFGVKVNLRQHLRLRVEGRDYISSNPERVIAPAPGASLSGILHDALGLAALSYTF